MKRIQIQVDDKTYSKIMKTYYGVAEYDIKNTKLNPSKMDFYVKMLLRGCKLEENQEKR